MEHTSRDQELEGLVGKLNVVTATGFSIQVKRQPEGRKERPGEFLSVLRDLRIHGLSFVVSVVSRFAGTFNIVPIPLANDLK